MVIPRPPQPAWSGFAIISSAKQGGVPILGYVPGGDPWSIGQRCRLLMAGVERLFFKNEEAGLFASLHHAAGAVAASAAEQTQLRLRMEELGIVAQSAAMAGLFRTTLRIGALSEIPVLITGESGTGKELFARAIHRIDRSRAAFPFLGVNCAALSPQLMESELFGYRRGAFTGADRDRPGLFRGAGRGVLFLDEIGEMDPLLQAKLLRTLQTGTILPVGEDREQPVNVRIVAATNRPLEQMVAQKQFREDLYHRLNVVHLRIPPLRERPEDVRPLAEFFLAKHRALCPAEVPAVSEEFIAALAGATLPGNARQLENIVRFALANKTVAAPLGLADCPQEIWSELSERESRQQAAPPGSLENAVAQALLRHEWSLVSVLDECERIAMKTALDHSHGNQSETARLLRITPRTIYNKLRKHRLSA